MKGILFKPDMIEAIIEGRKTQARRLGGFKEINQVPDDWQCIGDVHSYNSGEARRIGFKHKHLYLRSITPRYQVGETVYIKEAWGIDDCGKYVPLASYVWPGRWPVKRLIYKADKRWSYTLWPEFSSRSPLFMPEWAARYFILIKDVRAERLQEITIHQMGKEAIQQDTRIANWHKYMPQKFIELWDSINKDYPWESNPWCFRYEFELKEKEK